MSERVPVRWRDGEVVSGPPEPDSPPQGPICYTTARVTGGRALHLGRHLRRIQRDARKVEIGEVPLQLVRRAFLELGRHAFGEGTGIIRVEARRNSSHRVSIAAEARELGAAPERWRAIVAPIPHSGPDAWSGAKLLHRKLYDEARALSDAAGVDEAILVDGDGNLVEGARTNLVIIDAEGRPHTPDLRLGAVEGLARELLSERVSELSSRILHVSELRQSREIIATNAVRGACPIVELDGEAIGDGAPGPWLRRLEGLFAVEDDGDE
jgi:D-alanine transaminase